MVSKQKKCLRDQARLRAEHFEAEQAEKLASRIAVQATHDTEAINDARLPKIAVNPATGRKMCINSNSSVLSTSPKVTTQTTSANASNPCTIMSDELEMTMITGQVPTYKKKKRNGHKRCTKVVKEANEANAKSTSSYNLARCIAPEVSNFPNLLPFKVLRPVANDVSAASGTDGNVAPPIPTKAYHRESPNQPIKLIQDRGQSDQEDEPAKSLFSQPFADNDMLFTFNSIHTASPSNHRGANPPNTTTSAINLTRSDTEIQFSTPDPGQGRTIFDVLKERYSSKPVRVESSVLHIAQGKDTHFEKWNVTDERVDKKDADNLQGVDGPKAMDDEPTIGSPDFAIVPDALIAAIETVNSSNPSLTVLEASSRPTASSTSSVSCRMLSRAPMVDQPGDTIFVALSTWAIKETVRLHQLEMLHAMCNEEQTTSTHHAKNIELDLCHLPLLATSKGSRTPAKRRSMADRSVTTWDSHRIFFVEEDGTIRLVNLTETLYNVDVEIDDGASDFDSIASPMKITPWVTPISENDETTSSGESTQEVDSADLADLGQFSNCKYISSQFSNCKYISSQFSNCKYISSENVLACGDTTPLTELDFVDDEDVIDPCLVFMSAKPAKAVDLEAENLSRIVERITPTVGVEAQQMEVSASRVSWLAMTEAGCDNPEEPGELSDDMIVKHDFSSHHYAMSESGVDTGYVLSEDVDLSAAHKQELHVIDTTNVSVKAATPSEVPDDATVTENESMSSHNHSASALDRASELKRITLGTKDLLTFLELLTTSDNGCTTKSNVVTTFLQLVNIKRKKLGERVLPFLYTTDAVMASKIVPHTVFLGTTSLATFLEHLAFGLDDETTAKDVYCVFKTLSKEHLTLEVQAKTAVFGALGCRSRKLTKDYMAWLRL